MPAEGREARHETDVVPRLLDLDDPLCTDPHNAGAKAAALALARQRGFRVLPGFVVTLKESRPYIDLGVDALARRGSGGARLEIIATTLDPALESELRQRSVGLGNVLVARSSSQLEESGEWSGAFTSYLDISPDEVARAVKGCWAAVFSVAAMHRMESSGIRPASVEMAVLIQPALDPTFGGTAHIDGEEIVITAIRGSPARLVQGWEPGVQTRVGSRKTTGEAGIRLLGEERLAAIASSLWRAREELEATGCEWAVVDREVYILQLTKTKSSPTRHLRLPSVIGDRSPEISRLVRRFPGPLGEELVLPWALGTVDAVPPDQTPVDIDPRQALAEARAHADQLVAQVWGRPKEEAYALARRSLQQIRSMQADNEILDSLRRPDLERARFMLSCLATVRQAVAQRGTVTWPETAWYLDLDTIRSALTAIVPKRHRFGFDRWEPFHAAVGITAGQSVGGIACGPGVAFGRLRWVYGSDTMETFRPRDVIVAPYPTPNLAPLLWDAAGVVTVGGGPAAHLFESARALAIPAVAGVHLEEAIGNSPEKTAAEYAVTVDGSAGVIFVSTW